MRDMRFIKVFCCSIVLGIPACAKDFVGLDFRRHEIKVGFGTGISFEGDVYNTENDTKIEPDVFYNVEYDFNIDETWALGASMHGFTQNIPGVVTTSPGGEPQKINNKFHLMAYGLKGKYFFTRTPIHTFGFMTLDFANGGTVSRLTDPDHFKGFLVGGGGGCLVELFKHLGLSLEGGLDFGAAQWEAKPFSNSNGLEINPGNMGAVFNVIVMW
jgi:hypothetical protein